MTDAIVPIQWLWFRWSTSLLEVNLSSYRHGNSLFLLSMQTHTHAHENLRFSAGEWQMQDIWTNGEENENNRKIARSSVALN